MPITEADIEKIFFKILLNLLYRSIQDFFSFIYQYNMIADFFHLFHAVGAEDNRRPFLSQIIYFIFDKICVHRIQTTEWLIENYQLGSM